jgi:hypothetical protein
VRTALGVAAATAFLLACNDGVLDIGSDDGGGGDPIAPNFEPTAYDAAAVTNARALCDPSSPDYQTMIEQAVHTFTIYPAAELRSQLAGGWLLCSWGTANDARSLQFTIDGYWYTLVDDGFGGLRRAPPGTAPDANDASIGEEGTYTFLDRNRQPAASNGKTTLYVANDGAVWFHPEFMMLGAAPPNRPMAGPLMMMNFDDLSQDVCAFVGP